MPKQSALVIFFACHAALAADSGMAEQAQMMPSLDLIPPLAQSAPLNEQGYQLVAKQGGGDVGMKAFIRRLLHTLNREVEHESDFNGFVPHFSGSIAVQSFDRLQEELEKAEWTSLGRISSAETEDVENKTTHDVSSKVNSKVTVEVEGDKVSTTGKKDDAWKASLQPKVFEAQESSTSSLAGHSAAASSSGQNATSDSKVAVEAKDAVASTEAKKDDLWNASAHVNASEANASNASSLNGHAAEASLLGQNATSEAKVAAEAEDAVASTEAKKDDLWNASAHAKASESNASNASSLAGHSAAASSPGQNATRDSTVAAEAKEAGASPAAKKDDMWNASAHAKASEASASTASSLAGPSASKISSGQQIDVPEVAPSISKAISAQPTPSPRSVMPQSAAPDSSRKKVAEPVPATSRLRAGKSRTESSSVFRNVWNRIRGAVQTVLGSSGQQQQQQLQQQQQQQQQRQQQQQQQQQPPPPPPPPGMLRIPMRPQPATPQERNATVAMALKKAKEAEKVSSAQAVAEHVASEATTSANTVKGKAVTEKPTPVAEKLAAERSAAQKAQEHAAAERASAESIDRAVTVTTAAEKASFEQAAAGKSGKQATVAKAAAEKSARDVVTSKKAPAKQIAAVVSTAPARKAVAEQLARERVAAREAEANKATATKFAAANMSAKKVAAEQLAKERKMAKGSAEREAKLARIQKERDVKKTVLAARAAKLVEIRASGEALKNHSLALKSQMERAVEQSFSEARASTTSLETAKVIDELERPAAVAAAGVTHRREGAEVSEVRLRRRAEASAKLPDLDALLATSAEKLRGVQAHAEAIKNNVAAQMNQTKAALEQSRRSYDRQLEKYANDSKAISTMTHRIRNEIAAIAKDNLNIEDEANDIVKAHTLLRQTMTDLVSKLGLTSNFLTDSVDVTNDASAPALKVLRPTTPPPTLEHFLGLARKSLGVIGTEHEMSLLQTSGQTKARRNPLEDEERKPKTASDVLAGTIGDLKKHQDAGANALSAHYNKLLESAEAIRASLLAEQASVNITFSSLKQRNEKLIEARKYLQKQLAHLEKRLTSFRTFAKMLDSHLSVVTMQADSMA